MVEQLGKVVQQLQEGGVGKCVQKEHPLLVVLEVDLELHDQRPDLKLEPHCVVWSALVKDHAD